MSDSRQNRGDRRHNNEQIPEVKGVYLPDFAYFVRVLGRNFFKTTFFALFSACFIILSFFKFDYKYSSYETVTYSASDSLFEDDKSEAYFLGYEAKFHNTMRDGKFLYEAMEEVGLLRSVIGDPELYTQTGLIQGFLKTLIPAEYLPAKWQMEDDELTRNIIREELKDLVDTSSDLETRSLTLTVTTDNPGLSQDLAAVLMDAFVVRMYRYLLTEIEAGKNAHLNFIEEEKERAIRKNNAYGFYEEDKTENPSI